MKFWESLGNYNDIRNNYFFKTSNISKRTSKHPRLISVISMGCIYDHLFMMLRIKRPHVAVKIHI